MSHLPAGLEIQARPILTRHPAPNPARAPRPTPPRAARAPRSPRPAGLEIHARPIITRDTAPNPARMRRETLVLDGIWSLAVGDGALPPAVVPFAPQARVNGIAVPEGEVSLLYRTTFELPWDWEG